MEFVIAYLAIVALFLVFNHSAARERKRQEGLARMSAIFDENPDLLEDFDELDWYDWVEYSTCELCDELIIEEEVIIGLEDTDGEIIRFCEYCLNPDLKS